MEKTIDEIETIFIDRNYQNILERVYIVGICFWIFGYRFAVGTTVDLGQIVTILSVIEIGLHFICLIVTVFMNLHTNKHFVTAMIHR